MSGVLSFALFLLAVMIIVALITGIEYRQRLLTGSEAGFRLLALLLLFLSCVLFASIAAYLHTSIFNVLGSLFLLTMVILLGVIAFVAFRGKMGSRRPPEQRREYAPLRQTVRSRPQLKEAREEEQGPMES